MLPSRAVGNLRNGSWIYSELFRDDTLQYARRKLSTNFYNVGLRKFGLSVAFPSWGKFRVPPHVMFVAFSASTFVRHILLVLWASAKEEMIGVYAQRIVPIGTVVKDAQAIRNGTAKQFPRHSMSKND